jgi:hypothetical protein
MRDFRLLGESINLSSAIRISGYPSVISTLCEVGDNHSAWRVYEWVLKDGKLDVRWSAEGLHKAVRAQKDRKRVKGKHDSLLWVSYIYVSI